ncbi:BIG/ATPase V1 complex, subunit S1 [Diplogelasinospora grovesii]|uniref:Protein BIG1 n=1 Tax=Diplogelasinospora grovesii TaxID=303347 RepID=A0AAN6NHB8_9PEZI|nr:BIG/ATPase V1 complex, subunit S1 [Diplogelasinospora grovesii]
MQLSLLTAAVLPLAVQAFSDSSPFVLFSTSELGDVENNAQLQTSTSVISTAKRLLSSCPTERYLIVSQPNAHAVDIRGSSGESCNMPNLCQFAASTSVKSRFDVAEVIGQISMQPLVDFVEASCLEQGKAAKVEKVELNRLSSIKEATKRKEMLADNDHELGQLLERLTGGFTVLLFSDPNEFKAYEPEFVEAVHMDLKRAELDSEKAGKKKDNGTYDHRPLFEKYQFFTPGVFMALISLVIMLSILAVGLKALSSLEVSYGAFNKDMGPAAQKKQN